jgi:two-component SAPR family response regulator
VTEPAVPAITTADAPSGRAEIAVLSPALSVSAGGRCVTLAEMPARLLLALVLGHPHPVHVEQVVEELWPDGDPGAGRGRLSTVLHRLRRTLGPAGTAVVRDGDLLRLDPVAVVVDLWEHRAAVRQGGAAEAHALAAVAGNLCQAQFPYGERLVDARHAFAGDWARRARAAVRAGWCTADALAPAASALHVEPTEIED